MSSDQVVLMGAVADSTLKLATNTVRLSHLAHPVATADHFRVLIKVMTLVRACFRAPKFATIHVSPPVLDSL